MRAGEFLWDRIPSLVLQISALLGSAAFLSLTGTSREVLLLLLPVWLTGLALSLWIAFRREKAEIEELDAILDGLDRKYLFFECAPVPRRLYARKLFALLRRCGRGMIGAVSDAEESRKEYREYVERWVHEVKTPLTAARLLCQRLDGPARRRLSLELDTIDAHAERALYYARSENPEKDFVIRESSLEEICLDAVEAHRSLLQESGASVNLEGLAGTVSTDPKWAAFVVGQLLQNSARYCRENLRITFSARREGRRVLLTIADNGMGIPPEDLPRVYERGFTGSNGRARGGSTGLGLYLCRRLSDAMEVTLEITSVPGEGTRTVLGFPVRTDLDNAG